MSLYQPQDVNCPACEAPLTFDVIQSVNGDRRPDLREAILDDSFQRGACATCDHGFRLDPQLVYFDEALGLWVNAQPFEAQAEWVALEETTIAAFLQTYGPFTPDAVQAIGAGLRRRVTFGWSALREKLLCAQHGLDDGALEVAKVALLTQGCGDQLDDEAELRLADVNDDTLDFVWLMGPMEVPVEGFSVPRDILEDCAGPVWETVRASVSGDSFVDMNRALLADDELAS